MNFKKLIKLSGDASSRKFYRDKKNKYIVVLSKKEKKNKSSCLCSYK